MNKSILYLIILVGILVSVKGVEGACVNLTENMAPGGATTLCTNTYYANDSDQNGVVRLDGSNLDFNCNGSTIIGNNGAGSTGINSQWSGYTNITVRNCNLINYSIGILQESQNWNIYNNTLNHTTIGVKVDIYPWSNTISTNVSSNIFDYCGDYCAYITGASGNTINNNQLYRSSQFGFFMNRMNNSIIKYNVAKNIIMNALKITDGNINNNNTMMYNNVTNASRCIDVMGYNSVFAFNILNTCGHVAINAPDDVNSGTWHTGAYNRIYNNIVYNSGMCIYADGMILSNYTNNYCDGNNTRNDNSKSIGIETDGFINTTTGDNSEYGNIFSNNTLINYLDYAFNDNTENSSNIYSNNILNNTNYTGRGERNYLGTIGSLKVSFINNTQLSGISKYLFDVADPQLITIFDYNINNSLSLGDNKIINYYGNNVLKNYSIVNQTFNLYNFNLNSPYNDIKNTSNGAILATNVNNYSLTLAVNQQIEIGAFTSVNCYQQSGIICSLTGCSYGGVSCITYPLPDYYISCNQQGCYLA